MIVFDCSCGRQLQAREEDIGRQAKCPACGSVHVVPTGNDRVRDTPARRRDGEEDSRRRGRYPDDRGTRERRDDRYDEPAQTSTKALIALVLGLCSLFTCIVTGLPAIILGLLAVLEIGRSNGRLEGKGLAVTGVLFGFASILVLGPILFFYFAVYGSYREMNTETNNLKQVGLALHNYHDTHGRFPAAGDPFGQPNEKLSWRVAILPYIEQESLYRQFRLSEPWDSPHNIQFLQMMPKIYQTPGEKADTQGNTRVQAIVTARDVIGINAALDRKGGVPITSITDGTSNTILVGIAERKVPWTMPDDLEFSPTAPPPQFHNRNGFFRVLMCDGSTRRVSAYVSHQTLRQAMSRNGGEVMGGDW